MRICAMALHHRTCNLCEATCGIIIETNDGSITSIEGDREDPLSGGYLCPKAYALKDLREDPDRLTMPLLREGESWRELSWEEAFDAAAEGLHAVQKEGGRDALATFFGNPTVHNLGAALAGSPLIRTLGSRVRFSASSVDQFPHMLAAYLLYGAQLSLPVADVDRCNFFLVMGANPLASNGSLMTAPGMRRRLRALQKRGGRLVVVDPRRSETAAVADDHLFLRPGSDAFFVMAMLNVAFTEGRPSLGAAEGRVNGVEHLADLTEGFSPEAVQDFTGVEPQRLRSLVKDFIAEPAAACYARIGTCLQSYGTLTSVLVNAFNIVTGKLDGEGGMMFPQAALPAASRGHYGRWKSRVRGFREFGGEIPCATMAEEMETPGEGQIRALLTMACNPVLSIPNGTRVEKALAGLDFMVSIDPFLNETTRHAKVILPPRSSLENHQYSIAFHQLAVRDTAKFTKPVFEPAPGSKSEWEIVRGLCEAITRVRNRDLEAAGQSRVENPAAGVFESQPEALIAAMLAAGPYALAIDQLEQQPSGVDLGPLKPGGLDRAVVNEGGTIELRHTMVDSEVARLREDLVARRIGKVGLEVGRGRDDSFLLIGRRHLRSNNSWMHNCPSLVKGPARCTLLMNPADAARLGLNSGGHARVTSRVGSVELELELTEDLMPGVVSIPHGFGHTRPGARMRIAADHAGVSVNDLTDDEEVEGLVGNAVLNGVPVSVAAA